MKRKYYIAYGSNLNVGQMLHRCPDAIKIGTATIKDYQLLFRSNSRNAGVATVEPCKGKTVPVGIWVVSDDDEAALDRYEGWPWLYEKQVFSVTVKGKKVRGLIYIMTPGHRIAPPSDYYLDIIAEGYEDFGFDKAPLLEASANAEKGG